MEPLKGGKLAFAGNEQIAELWNNYPVHRTPVEWAFRYLADMDGINVILSGSSDMAQLCDTIDIFSRPDMTPGCIT